MKASRIVAVLAIASMANIDSGLAAEAIKVDWYTPMVGGVGGGRFDLFCNPHSYLAGIRVRAGDDIDSVSPICGQLLEGNARGLITYHDKAGGDGGQPEEWLCPPQAPFVRTLYIQGQGIDTVLVSGISMRCGPAVGPLPTQLERYNYFRVSTWHVDTWLKHNDKRTFECPNANTAFSGLFGRSGAFIDALGASCHRLVPAPQPAVFAQITGNYHSPALGGDGGVPFSTRCPANAYIAGFNVRTGDDIDAIGPICAQAYRNGERSKLVHQPQVGGSGGYLREMRCPTHFPFVRTFATSWEGVDRKLLNSISFVCGKLEGPLPPAVKDQTAFSFFLHKRSYSSFRPNSEGGSSGFPCPDGMSYAGLHGRAGAMVDALGVICDNTRYTLSSVGKKPPPPPVLSGKDDGRARDLPEIKEAPTVLNSTVSGEASTSRERVAAIEDAPATQGPGTVVPSTAQVEGARSTAAVRAATRRAVAPAAGLQLICRGIEGMLVQPSWATLPAGQKAYMVYFGVHLAARRSAPATM